MNDCAIGIPYGSTQDLPTDDFPLEELMFDCTASETFMKLKAQLINPKVKVTLRLTVGRSVSQSVNVDRACISSFTPRPIYLLISGLVGGTQ
jgi:hypothetical protein